MNKLKIIILLFLLFIKKNILAEDFPEVIPIDTIEQISEKIIEGDALFDYIDGAADLYLEYGFEKLKVIDYRYENINIKLEIFKMKDELGAFGLFSILKAIAIKDTSINAYVSMNPYQLQSFVGPYYITVTNNIGNEQAKTVSYDLLSKILFKINKSKYKVIKVPNEFRYDLNQDILLNLKYIRGPIGLQNGIAEWQEAFDVVSGFELFAWNNETGIDTASAFILSFQKENDLDNFYKQISISLSSNKNLHLDYYRNNLKLYLVISNNKNININTIFNLK